MTTNDTEERIIREARRLFIERGFEHLFGHTRKGAYVLDLVVRRVDEIDPAALFERLKPLKLLIFLRLKKFQHRHFPLASWLFVHLPMHRGAGMKKRTGKITVRPSASSPLREKSAFFQITR